MCKDLKPVKNLDDLLYQFYVNLDSDCLFNMSTARLEKLWGIKILDRGRVRPSEFSKLFVSTDFANKPYNSEKDAFFVERINRGSSSVMFRIIITSAYSNKHLTLFPEGNFPKLLPEPLKGHDYTEVYWDDSPDSKPMPYPKKPGVYSELGTYAFYWLSSDKTRVISISGVTSAVSEITVYNGANPTRFNESVE